MYGITPASPRCELLLRQAIQFVHQAAYLTVRGVYLTLEQVFVGRGRGGGQALVQTQVRRT